ncbi:MAG: hypothetical protein SF162_05850 [bacterium]|nr:hypothetical protein [bacterium]
MIVPLHPPFDFALTVRAAGIMSVVGRAEAGRYRRLFRAGDGLALIELTDESTAPEQPAVRAILIAESGMVDHAALWADVRHWLNPDADRRAFHAYAAADRTLGALVAPLHGMHPFRFERVFDALMATMIEQQISLRAAQLAETWLCAWGGHTLTHDGVQYAVFPRMSQIAAASVEALKPLKITFGRISRLIEIARLGMSGQIDFAALRAAPFDVVYPALMALKGVGHWTAAWTIIRACGLPVYIGRADVALRAAVNRAFFDQPGRADPDTMDALFAAFGAHAGDAAYHTIIAYALERYSPPTA